MTPEPLIAWPDPLLELLGFISVFLAAGAIGFRYFAARGLSAAGADPDGAESRFAGAATRRAALWGLVGGIGTLVFFALELPGAAEEHHLTVFALLTSDPATAMRLAFSALAILGLAAAARRRGWGWPLAAIGVVGSPLRAALLGRWLRLANPLHELAAGLWIGTLFLMVVVALAPLRKSALAPERRGALAAGMARAFSPWALASFGTLVFFGLNTAWRHLKRLDALWTTPYGYALIVKLCVVSVVLALGAWNWRRQLPRLGSPAAALDLERTARIELAAAFVVLLVTSVLVSLPSPR